MSEHLTHAQLLQYASGNLAPAQLLAADDHLSQCDPCRDQLSRLETVSRKMEQWPVQILIESAEHLRYESLESYVDGNCADEDLELIESHLRLCHACADQVANLQALKAEITLKRTPFVDQARMLWFSPLYSTAFRAVSLAAIVAFVSLILALVFHTADGRLQARLDETRQKGKQTEKQLLEKESQLQALTKKMAEMQNSSVLESIHDGDLTLALDKDKNLQGANQIPEPFQQMAALAVKDQRVSIPGWIADLQGSNETLMGPTEGVRFKLLSPVGVVVDSDRPEFSWEKLPEATGYRVKVYDASFHEVASSNRITATSWVSSASLPRGAVLNWVVSADSSEGEVLSPVPPAPAAKFKVLEVSTMKELENAKALHSHLLLGLAYAHAGMVPEARTELAELHKQNPNSALVAALLQSLTKR